MKVILNENPKVFLVRSNKRDLTITLKLVYTSGRTEIRKYFCDNRSDFDYNITYNNASAHDWRSFLRWSDYNLLKLKF